LSLDALSAAISRAALTHRTHQQTVSDGVD